MMKIRIHLVAFVIFLNLRETISGPHYCNRSLIGKVGIISSYNFPLDYASDLNCNYLHDFKDVEGKIEEICFRFFRFDLECPGDKLVIEGQIYCGSGEESMENLCFQTNGETFALRFQTDSSGVRSGFYAEYTVRTDRDRFTTIKPSSESILIADDTYRAKAFCADPQSFPCFSGEKCIDKKLTCGGSILRECDDGSEKTYAHARCPGPTGQLLLEHRNVRACDFSFGQSPNASSGIHLSDCKITVIKDDYIDDSWVLDIKSSDQEYGPKSVHNYRYDETYKEWNRYVRTNFSLPGRNDAQLRLDTYPGIYGSGKPYCLTFWYHMLGKDAGRLSVFWGAGKEGFSKPAWTREGNLGDHWYKAEIQRTPSFEDFFFQHIFFVAYVGGERGTQIALGDVTLMPNACHPNSDYELADDVSCTFEVGLCQWSDSSEWMTSNTFNENGDRGPPGASQGLYYLHPATDFPIKFASPFMANIMEHRCLILEAYSTIFDNAVAVSLRNRNGTISHSYEQGLTLKYEWERFQFNISSLVPFQIIIASTMGRMYFDNIAIIDNLCSNLDYETCKNSEYRCDGLLCIGRNELCNGVEDCPTGDDEMNCETSNRGLPQGVAIFLIILVCVLPLVAIFGGIIFWKKRKSKKNANQNQLNSGVDNDGFYQNPNYDLPQIDEDPEHNEDYDLHRNDISSEDIYGDKYGYYQR